MKIKSLFQLVLTCYLLFVSLSYSQAATDVAATLTGGTANNVGSSNRWVITKLTVTATTTNATTVRFYDTGAATTNLVTSAYTDVISYATNITTTYTNTTGEIQTNTIAGTYTVNRSVAAATNEAPRLAIIAVAGSASVTRDVNLVTAKGLNALSDNDAVLVVTYRAW